MRLACSIALITLAPVMLRAQDAQSEPWLADAAEYGLPLPPSAQEVNALSPDAFSQQAAAIKRVCLLQQLQFVEDGFIMTDGNRMASVYLAIKLKAPASYIALLQAEAGGSLSTRQYRVLNRAYDRLYELYRVDAIGIRLFAQSELASPEELAIASESLPLESLFNLVNTQEINEETAAADLQEVAGVFSELTKLYVTIDHAQKAAAAVPQVNELVRRFAAVYPRLALAPDSVRRRLESAYALKIKPLLPPLIAQRQRLREENFYGIPHLKILDYFFD